MSGENSEAKTRDPGLRKLGRRQEAESKAALTANPCVASVPAFIQRFLSLLQGVSPNSYGWQALCPAHSDTSPSLSIGTGDDGRILLKCHAGCSAEDVCRSVGLKLSDLFPGAAKPVRERVKQTLVETYSYTDANGKEIFQVLRYEPGKHGKTKDFRQRHGLPGSTDWIWDMKGVQRELYQLPRVLAAIARGETIFLVEGERKVHTLETFGLTGTCNSGGAGKWLARYTETLTGAKVCVLPDNDNSGRGHTTLAAGNLHGKTASLRIVELPGLPQKGDIVDWVKAGGTREQLFDLCRQTDEWVPTAAVEQSRDVAEVGIPGSAPDGYPLTDLGNAERLVRAHGENLRFNVDADQWLCWDGRRWAWDATGKVNRLARKVVRGLYDLLKECETTLERDDLYRHVKRSESAMKLEAMVKLARHCRGIPVQSADLDSDPWLFNCANGTLELKTGMLRGHRQSDLLTKLSAVRYDANAKADRWEQFLSEVFLDDKELIAFVQRMSGYLLAGDTREQCFLLFTGKGSNGKSVLVNTLSFLFGDYAQGTPVTTFLERRGENTSDLASLPGARLVTASEGEGVTSFNESLLKQLTGGDPITARHNYGRHWFTYRPSFKVIFATNEVRRIRSQNYAMRRRVKMLPFRQRFYYAHEQQKPVRDEGLGDKLKAEASGILAWCVRGCMEWQNIGLGMPDAIREEVEGLFTDMDPLAEFIETQCRIHPGAKVEVGAIWDAYTRWCRTEGRPLAFKQTCYFTRNLYQRDGIDPKRGGGGVRYMTGIELLDVFSGSEVTPGDAIPDPRESS